MDDYNNKLVRSRFKWYLPN